MMLVSTLGFHFVLQRNVTVREAVFFSQVTSVRECSDANATANRVPIKFDKLTAER